MQTEQMEKIESTFRALIAQADVTASHYQQDIFRAVLRGGRYIVAAVPGSGKTWTIVQSLRFVRSGASVLMTAFNKDAGDRLNVRANDFVRSLVAQHAAAGDTAYVPPFVDARNIHRVGTETLLANRISFKKNGSKYYKIVDAFLNARGIQPKTMDTFKSQAVKLLEKLRLTLSDENDAEVLHHLCLNYDVAIDRYEGGDDFFVEEEEQEETAEWKLLVELMPYAIAEGIRIARAEGVVDFTDMIWLPVRLKMKMYRTFDYLFLDEGQDFNACQRELLLACAKPLSTIFVFGDRNQAIYSWAGASENSLDEMKVFLGAEELPLSICYRCAKSIVRKAADVFYGIEAADDAEEGHVEYIDRESVAQRAEAGYWILGRWTKDLVALCLEMLLSGKRANVKGKDQGAQVKTQLENLKKFNKNFKSDTFLALPQFAGDYKRRLSDDFEKVEDKEEKQEKFDRTMDQIETLLLLFDAYRACWNEDYSELDEGAAFAKFLQPAIRDKRTGKLVGYGALPVYPSLENFQAMIDNFFAEDKPGDEKEQIVLMTIHRSKGGENEVVVILDYDVLPSKKPTKKTKSIKEEMNLEYVAVSRAQKTLFLAVNILAVPANPIYTGLQPNENEISNTEYLERQAEQMRKMTTTIVDAEVVEITPVAAIEAADSVPALPAPVPAPTTEKKKGGRKASGKADATGRIRQKWQGTFDPKTLQFLSALVENGDIADKSRFVEQLIQSTDLFQAWSAAQEEDETPNPDDDGGNGGGAPAPAQDSVEEEAATDAAVPPAAAQLDIVEARHAWMPETVAADEEESNVAGTILRSWADALLQDERQADEIAIQTVLFVPTLEDEAATQQTVRFFFHCKSYANGKQCSHRWTRDYTVDAAGVPFRMEDGTRVTLADDARHCPKCSKHYISYKPIKARHSSTHQCNDICRYATGPKCTCSCGGAHHGEGHVVGATLFAGTKQTDFVSFEHLRTEV